MLDSLSDNRSVRSSLLGAASLLVLVAFTLLCQKRPNLSGVESARWGEHCVVGWPIVMPVRGLNGVQGAALR